jgi:small subunit ribosomal protein S9
MEVVNALGRRKSAIARIFVSEGTGKITINKRDLAEYFSATPSLFNGCLTTY